MEKARNVDSESGPDSANEPGSAIREMTAQFAAKLPARWYASRCSRIADAIRQIFATATPAMATDGMILPSKATPIGSSGKKFMLDWPVSCPVTACGGW